MMRFFMYCRKSTDEDDRQMLSIDAQIRELREFARKESLHVVHEFVETKTAKVPGRPIFNEMIALLESGQAEGILAWHPDRLARNSVDGGRIIYLIDMNRLSALKFPTFWFDCTPQGKFMLSIAFGQSKYYVDNLSENIQRGIREKLVRGEYPGLPPVGYLNHPKQRNIVMDEQKAPLVRRLFEFYAEGVYTYKQLSDLAFEWGLRSHAGNRIKPNKIPEILAHPFYTGIFVIKGEIYQGSHDALIPKKLFDHVQTILKRRGWKATPHHDDSFHFLGLLRCGECGAAITAERQKGHHYYRCTKKMGPCSQKHYLREEVLAERLKESIRRVAISDEWANNMLAEVEKERANESKQSKPELFRRKDRLVEIQTTLDRLLDGFLEGVVSKEEYTARKNKLIEEKMLLTAQLEDLKTQGALWLEPLAEFIKQANQAEKVINSDNWEQLRNFHLKIGSNLVLREWPAEVLPEIEEAQASRRPDRSSRIGNAASRFSSGNSSFSDFLAFRPEAESRQKSLPILFVQFSEPWHSALPQKRGQSTSRTL